MINQYKGKTFKQVAHKKAQKGEIWFGDFDLRTYNAIGWKTKRHETVGIYEEKGLFFSVFVKVKELLAAGIRLGR
jgi:hypothetical protein